MVAMMVEVAMVEVSVVDIAMVEEIRQRELQWLGFSECGGPYRCLLYTSPSPRD